MQNGQNLNLKEQGGQRHTVEQHAARIKQQLEDQRKKDLAAQRTNEHGQSKKN